MLFDASSWLVFGFGCDYKFYESCGYQNMCKPASCQAVSITSFRPS